MRGEEPVWPDRTLFVHSQRIEQVKKGRNNSVMTKRWRLVGNKELYDITADPYEWTNLAANAINAPVRKRFAEALEEILAKGE